MRVEIARHLDTCSNKGADDGSENDCPTLLSVVSPSWWVSPLCRKVIFPPPLGCSLLPVPRSSSSRARAVVLEIDKSGGMRLGSCLVSKPPGAKFLPGHFFRASGPEIELPHRMIEKSAKASLYRNRVLDVRVTVINTIIKKDRTKKNSVRSRTSPSRCSFANSLILIYLRNVYHVFDATLICPHLFQFRSLDGMCVMCERANGQGRSERPSYIARV